MSALSGLEALLGKAGRALGISGGQPAQGQQILEDPMPAMPMAKFAPIAAMVAQPKPFLGPNGQPMPAPQPQPSVQEVAPDTVLFGQHNPQDQLDGSLVGSINQATGFQLPRTRPTNANKALIDSINRATGSNYGNY